MDRSRHSRLTDLYREALDLPAPARRAFVAEQCAGDDELARELLGLLESEAPDSFLETPALVAAGEGATSAIPAPAAIPGYELGELLGEGGMGSVHRARQLATGQEVAIKLLRGQHQPSSIRERFEREGRILGRLRHPGIARVLDAGTFDDDGVTRPFLAMELVEGATLTAHATAMQLGRNARLELLVAIGDAVQHAHGKGVIHRDLKPANILVGADGAPKVLDFGVARLVDPDTAGSETADPLQTRQGQVLGTLPYMAPEQIAGDADRTDGRADVYALGVVAYELLTGQLPVDLHGLSIPAAAARVANTTIVPAGQRNRRLRGDVELVLGKALRSEPEERYPSPGAFASDLRRVLAHEPIEARPASTLYQLRKFTRRHRVLVGSTLGIMLGLGVGVVLAVHGMREAEAARDQAQTELAKVRRIRDFVVGMFGGADRFDLGKNLRVRELLDRADRSIGEVDDLPEVAAAIHQVMGRAYRRVTEWDKAAEHVDRALELLRRLDDVRVDDELDLLVLRAAILVRKGEFDEPGRQLESLLGANRDRLGRTHPLVVKLRTEQAKLWLESGRSDDGLAAMQALYDELVQEHGESTAVRSAREELAMAFDRAGRIKEAIELFEAVDSDMCATRGADHPDVHIIRTRRAQLLMLQNRLAEAATLAREALDHLDAGLGPRHTMTLRAVSALGLIHKRQRNYPAAKVQLERSLASQLAVNGPDHPDTQRARNNLSQVLLKLGERDRGLELLREAIAVERGRDYESPDLSVMLYNLGTFCYDDDRHEEALELFEQSLEHHLRVKGPDHYGAVITRFRYARQLIELKKWPEAAAEVATTVREAERILPADNYRIFRYQAYHGYCLSKTGEPDAARSYLVERFDRIRERLGDDDQHTGLAARTLVRVFEEAGTPELAAPYRAFTGR